MSFLIKNWGRVSVTYNPTAPTTWTYTGIKNGISDTLTTIKTTGYFNLVENSFLKVHDIIEIVGTDGQQTIEVDELNPVVVVNNSYLPVGEIYIGDGQNHATPRVMLQDVTIDAFGLTTIEDGVVTKLKLATAVRPEWIVVFAGVFQSGSVSTIQIFPALGVLNTDLVFIQVSNFNGSASRILSSVTTIDEIIVEWDIPPGSIMTLSAQAIRAT